MNQASDRRRTIAAAIWDYNLATSCSSKEQHRASLPVHRSTLLGTSQQSQRATTTEELRQHYALWAVLLIETAATTTGNDLRSSSTTITGQCPVTRRLDAGQRLAARPGCLEQRPVTAHKPSLELTITTPWCCLYVRQSSSSSKYLIGYHDLQLLSVKLMTFYGMRCTKSIKKVTNLEVFVAN